MFQSKFYLYLSHIFLVRCPDKELENVRNKADIMAAGWNLNLKNDPIATSRYRKHCGTDKFWGYKYELFWGYFLGDTFGDTFGMPFWGYFGDNFVDTNMFGI